MSLTNLNSFISILQFSNFLNNISLFSLNSFNHHILIFSSSSWFVIICCLFNLNFGYHWFSSWLKMTLVKQLIISIFRISGHIDNITALRDKFLENLSRLFIWIKVSIIICTINILSYVHCRVYQTNRFLFIKCTRLFCFIFLTWWFFKSIAACAVFFMLFRCHYFLFRRSWQIGSWTKRNSIFRNAFFCNAQFFRNFRWLFKFWRISIIGFRRLEK